MNKRSLIWLILLTIFTSGLSTASAHTVLIGSDPTANSTVTRLPEQITLTFADSLLVLGAHTINEVQVIDPMGLVITSKNNVVKGAKLSNVLTPKMVMAGHYHVSFRVVAQDGHVITGTYIFSVGKSAKSPVLAVTPPLGVYHITALANGAGIMNGVGSARQSAKLSLDLDFFKSDICYNIETTISDVLAVHVHSMNQTNMTISDEIFLPLNPASINSLKPICDHLATSILTTLYDNANRYMVVLHTKSFPNGAVAGRFIMHQSTVDSSIVLNGVTATVSKAGGTTALSLTLTNNLRKPILLTGITSSLATSSMIFFDANMCIGNTFMTQLQNIVIGPNHDQVLGYKYQGAMLAGLEKDLKVGSQIPIAVHWVDSKGVSKTLNTLAKVVSPPAGLHFAMAGMG